MREHLKTWTAAAALLAAGPAVAAEYVYVPLGAAGRVQVVDPDTSRVVGAVEEVGNVHGLALTPDGRFLVAGSFSETQPGTAAAPPKPAGMSEAEHAKHHAARQPAPAAAGTSYVSVIDTSTLRVVRRVAVRGAVHHVAVSPDGRYAVTTHPGAGTVSAIDLRDYRVAGSVPTGAMPNYAAFSRDGTRLYVSNAGDGEIAEIDTARWQVTRRMPAGLSPEHLVLSADGRTLYTNDVEGGTAYAISLADGSIAGRFPVGEVPHGIALSDDGATLFASSKDGNRLVAVDLASGESRSVALAPAPYHVTAVPGKRLLLVSSRAQKRIWILDQETLATRGEVSIGGIGHQMVVAAR